MSITNLKQIIVACLCVWLFSACSSTQKTHEYSTPQKNHQINDISHLSDRERADLYQSILSADIAAANGEFEVATSYYLAAARLSRSIDLIRLGIDSAIRAGDQLAILQASELWLEIEPKQTEAIIYKINGSLALQDLETALITTETLIQREKHQRKLAQHLDKVIESIPPPVTNAFLGQLSARYADSLAVSYTKAAFFVNIAKLTKQPGQMNGRAVAILNQVLQKKPDFIPALELKIGLLYQAHQDQKAEALLRKLHAEYPKSSEISHLLGQLLYDLGKFELAKQHYQQWTKKRKSDSKAYFYLAASYYALNEFDDSLRSYQHILGSDYKTQSTYFFCGNAASHLKQLAQAAACYSLVEDGQYLTRSKIELAKIQVLQGNVEEALKTVRNPKYAPDEKARIQLINIEVEIINQHISKEKAKQRLDSAIAKYPNAPSLVFRKISVEELQNNPESLIELFVQAEPLITDEKKNHQFNITAANFLRNNHHYQQAVDWLTQALEKRPEDRDYIYTISERQERSCSVF